MLNIVFLKIIQHLDDNEFLKKPLKNKEKSTWKSTFSCLKKGPIFRFLWPSTPVSSRLKWLWKWIVQELEKEVFYAWVVDLMMIGSNSFKRMELLLLASTPAVHLRKTRSQFLVYVRSCSDNPALVHVGCIQKLFIERRGAPILLGASEDNGPANDRSWTTIYQTKWNDGSSCTLIAPKKWISNFHNFHVKIRANQFLVMTLPPFDYFQMIQ